MVFVISDEHDVADWHKERKIRLRLLQARREVVASDDVLHEIRGLLTSLHGLLRQKEDALSTAEALRAAVAAVLIGEEGQMVECVSMLLQCAVRDPHGMSDDAEQDLQRVDLLTCLRCSVDSTNVRARTAMLSTLGDLCTQPQVLPLVDVALRAQLHEALLAKVAHKTGRDRNEAVRVLDQFVQVGLLLDEDLWRLLDLADLGAYMNLVIGSLPTSAAAGLRGAVFRLLARVLRLHSELPEEVQNEDEMKRVTRDIVRIATDTLRQHAEKDKDALALEGALCFLQEVLTLLPQEGLVDAKSLELVATVCVWKCDVVMQSASRYGAANAAIAFLEAHLVRLAPSLCRSVAQELKSAAAWKSLKKHLEKLSREGHASTPLIGRLAGTVAHAAVSVGNEVTRRHFEDLLPALASCMAEVSLGHVPELSDKHRQHFDQARSLLFRQIFNEGRGSEQVKFARQIAAKKYEDSDENVSVVYLVLRLRMFSAYAPAWTLHELQQKTRQLVSRVSDDVTLALLTAGDADSDRWARSSEAEVVESGQAFSSLLGHHLGDCFDALARLMTTLREAQSTKPEHASEELHVDGVSVEAAVLRCVEQMLRLWLNRVPRQKMRTRIWATRSLARLLAALPDDMCLQTVRTLAAVLYKASTSLLPENIKQSVRASLASSGPREYGIVWNALFDFLPNSRPATLLRERLLLLLRQSLPSHDKEHLQLCLDLVTEVFHRDVAATARALYRTSTCVGEALRHSEQQMRRTVQWLHSGLCEHAPPLLRAVMDRVHAEPSLAALYHLADEVLKTRGDPQGEDENEETRALTASLRSFLDTLVQQLDNGSFRDEEIEFAALSLLLSPSLRHLRLERTEQWCRCVTHAIKLGASVPAAIDLACDALEHLRQHDTGHLATALARADFFQAVQQHHLSNTHAEDKGRVLTEEETVTEPAGTRLLRLVARMGDACVRSLRQQSRDTGAASSKQTVRWQLEDAAAQLRVPLFHNTVGAIGSLSEEARDVADETLCISLDETLPRVINLALHAASRRLKVAACETLHVMTTMAMAHDSCVPEAQATSRHFWEHVLPPVLRLAASGDTVAEQLFSVLAAQCIHWFAGRPVEKDGDFAFRPHQHREVLLDTISKLLSNKESGESSRKLRDFAARCFGEYFEHVLDPLITLSDEDRLKSAGALLKRILRLLRDSHAQQRTSGAMALQQVARCFRTRPFLLSGAVLRVLQQLLVALDFPGAEEPAASKKGGPVHVIDECLTVFVRMVRDLRHGAFLALCLPDRKRYRLHDDAVMIKASGAIDQRQVAREPWFLLRNLCQWLLRQCFQPANAVVRRAALRLLLQLAPFCLSQQEMAQCGVDTSIYEGAVVTGGWDRNVALAVKGLRLHDEAAQVARFRAFLYRELGTPLEDDKLSDSSRVRVQLLRMCGEAPDLADAAICADDDTGGDIAGTGGADGSTLRLVPHRDLLNMHTATQWLRRVSRAVAVQLYLLSMPTGSKTEQAQDQGDHLLRAQLEVLLPRDPAGDIVSRLLPALRDLALFLPHSTVTESLFEWQQWCQRLIGDGFDSDDAVAVAVAVEDDDEEDEDDDVGLDAVVGTVGRDKSDEGESGDNEEFHLVETRFRGLLFDTARLSSLFLLRLFELPQVQSGLPHVKEALRPVQSRAVQALLMTWMLEPPLTVARSSVLQLQGTIQRVLNTEVLRQKRETAQRVLYCALSSDVRRQEITADLQLCEDDLVSVIARAQGGSDPDRMAQLLRERQVRQTPLHMGTWADVDRMLLGASRADFFFNAAQKLHRLGLFREIFQDQIVRMAQSMMDNVMERVKAQQGGKSLSPMQAKVARKIFVLNCELGGRDILETVLRRLIDDAAGTQLYEHFDQDINRLIGKNSEAFVEWTRETLLQLYAREQAEDGDTAHRRLRLQLLIQNYLACDSTNEDDEFGHVRSEYRVGPVADSLARALWTVCFGKHETVRLQDELLALALTVWRRTSSLSDDMIRALSWVLAARDRQLDAMQDDSSEEVEAMQKVRDERIDRSANPDAVLDTPKAVRGVLRSLGIETRCRALALVNKAVRCLNRSLVALSRASSLPSSLRVVTDKGVQLDADTDPADREALAQCWRLKRQLLHALHVFVNRAPFTLTSHDHERFSNGRQHDEYVRAVTYLLDEVLARARDPAVVESVVEAIAERDHKFGHRVDKTIARLLGTLCDSVTHNLVEAQLRRLDGSTEAHDAGSHAMQHESFSVLTLPVVQLPYESEEEFEAREAQACTPEGVLQRQCRRAALALSHGAPRLRLWLSSLLAFVLDARNDGALCLDNRRLWVLHRVLLPLLQNSGDLQPALTVFARSSLSSLLGEYLYNALGKEEDEPGWHSAQGVTEQLRQLYGMRATRVQQRQGHVPTGDLSTEAARRQYQRVEREVLRSSCPVRMTLLDWQIAFGVLEQLLLRLTPRLLDEWLPQRECLLLPGKGTASPRRQLLRLLANFAFACHGESLKQLRRSSDFLHRHTDQVESDDVSVVVDDMRAQAHQAAWRAAVALLHDRSLFVGTDRPKRAQVLSNLLGTSDAVFEHAIALHYDGQRPQSAASVGKKKKKKRPALDKTKGALAAMWRNLVPDDLCVELRQDVMRLSVSGTSLKQSGLQRSHSKSLLGDYGASQRVAHLVELQRQHREQSRVLSGSSAGLRSIATVATSVATPDSSAFPSVSLETKEDSIDPQSNQEDTEQYGYDRGDLPGAGSLANDDEYHAHSAAGGDSVDSDGSFARRRFLAHVFMPATCDEQLREFYEEHKQDGSLDSDASQGAALAVHGTDTKTPKSSFLSESLLLRKDKELPKQKPTGKPQEEEDEDETSEYLQSQINESVRKVGDVVDESGTAHLSEALLDDDALKGAGMLHSLVWLLTELRREVGGDFWCLEDYEKDTLVRKLYPKEDTKRLTKRQRATATGVQLKHLVLEVFRNSQSDFESESTGSGVASPALQLLWLRVVCLKPALFRSVASEFFAGAVTLLCGDPRDDSSRGLDASLAPTYCNLTSATSAMSLSFSMSMRTTELTDGADGGDLVSETKTALEQLRRERPDHAAAFLLMYGAAGQRCHADTARVETLLEKRDPVLRDGAHPLSLRRIGRTGGLVFQGMHYVLKDLVLLLVAHWTDEHVDVGATTCRRLLEHLMLPGVLDDVGNGYAIRRKLSDNRRMVQWLLARLLPRMQGQLEDLSRFPIQWLLLRRDLDDKSVKLLSATRLLKWQRAPMHAHTARAALTLCNMLLCLRMPVAPRATQAGPFAQLLHEALKHANKSVYLPAATVLGNVFRRYVLRQRRGEQSDDALVKANITPHAKGGSTDPLSFQLLAAVVKALAGAQRQNDSESRKSLVKWLRVLSAVGVGFAVSVAFERTKEEDEAIRMGLQSDQQDEKTKVRRRHALHHIVQAAVRNLRHDVTACATAMEALARFWRVEQFEQTLPSLRENSDDASSGPSNETLPPDSGKEAVLDVGGQDCEKYGYTEDVALFRCPAVRNPDDAEQLWRSFSLSADGEHLLIQLLQVQSDLGQRWQSLMPGNTTYITKREGVALQTCRLLLAIVPQLPMRDMAQAATMLQSVLSTATTAPRDSDSHTLPLPYYLRVLHLLCRLFDLVSPRVSPATPAEAPEWTVLLQVRLALLRGMTHTAIIVRRLCGEFMADGAKARLMHLALTSYRHGVPASDPVDMSNAPTLVPVEDDNAALAVMRDLPAWIVQLHDRDVHVQRRFTQSLLLQVLRRASQHRQSRGLLSAGLSSLRRLRNNTRLQQHLGSEERLHVNRTIDPRQRKHSWTSQRQLSVRPADSVWSIGFDAFDGSVAVNDRIEWTPTQQRSLQRNSLVRFLKFRLYKRRHNVTTVTPRLFAAGINTVATHMPNMDSFDYAQPTYQTLRKSAASQITQIISQGAYTQHLQEEAKEASFSDEISRGKDSLKASQQLASVPAYRQQPRQSLHDQLLQLSLQSAQLRSERYRDFEKRYCKAVSVYKLDRQRREGISEEKRVSAIDLRNDEYREGNELQATDYLEDEDGGVKLEGDYRVGKQPHLMLRWRQVLRPLQLMSALDSDTASVLLLQVLRTLVFFLADADLLRRLTHAIVTVLEQSSGECPETQAFLLEALRLCLEAVLRRFPSAGQDSPLHVRVLLSRLSLDRVVRKASLNVQCVRPCVALVETLLRPRVLSMLSNRVQTHSRVLQAALQGQLQQAHIKQALLLPPSGTKEGDRRQRGLALLQEGRLDQAYRVLNELLNNNSNYNSNSNSNSNGNSNGKMNDNDSTGDTTTDGSRTEPRHKRRRIEAADTASAHSTTASVNEGESVDAETALWQQERQDAAAQLGHWDVVVKQALGSRSPETLVYDWLRGEKSGVASDLQYVATAAVFDAARTGARAVLARMLSAVHGDRAASERVSRAVATQSALLFALELRHKIVGEEIANRGVVQALRTQFRNRLKQASLQLLHRWQEEWRSGVACAGLSEQLALLADCEQFVDLLTCRGRLAVHKCHGALQEQRRAGDRALDTEGLTSLIQAWQHQHPGHWATCGRWYQHTHMHNRIFKEVEKVTHAVAQLARIHADDDDDDDDLEHRVDEFSELETRCRGARRVTRLAAADEYTRRGMLTCAHAMLRRVSGGTVSLLPLRDADADDMSDDDGVDHETRQLNERLVASHLQWHQRRLALRPTDSSEASEALLRSLKTQLSRRAEYFTQALQATGDDAEDVLYEAAAQRSSTQSLLSQAAALCLQLHRRHHLSPRGSPTSASTAAVAGNAADDKWTALAESFLEPIALVLEKYVAQEGGLHMHEQAEALFRYAQFCEERFAALPGDLRDSLYLVKEAPRRYQRHHVRHLLLATSMGHRPAHDALPLALETLHRLSEATRASKLPRLYRRASAEQVAAQVDVRSAQKDLKVCARTALQLPPWMWLRWLPQLLSSLGHAERRYIAPVAKAVALRYPQAVFYPLNVSFEDMHDITRRREAAARAAVSALRQAMRAAHPALCQTMSRLLDGFALFSNAATDVYESMRNMASLLSQVQYSHPQVSWRQHVAPVLKAKLLPLFSSTLAYCRSGSATGGHVYVNWQRSGHCLAYLKLVFGPSFVQKTLHNDTACLLGGPKCTHTAEQLCDLALQSLSELLSINVQASSLSTVSVMRTLRKHAIDLNPRSSAVDKVQPKFHVRGRRAALMSDMSFWLANYHQGSEVAVQVPGQYDAAAEHYVKPDDSQHVCIARFESHRLMLASMRQPQRIGIVGDDERKHRFLLKTGEDLRLDARIEQAFGVMNRCLNSHTQARRREMRVDTYAVLPLSHNVGLVAWVPDTDTMRSLIDKQVERCNAVVRNRAERLQQQTRGKRPRNEDTVPRAPVRKYLPVREASKSLQETAAELTKNDRKRNERPNAVLLDRVLYQAPRHKSASPPCRLNPDVLLEMRAALEKAEQCLPERALQRAVVSRLASSAQAWLTLRGTLAQSTAVLLVAMYLLGVDDRHPENWLISKRTGRMVGIDFGQSFGLGHSLPVPGLVPCRITSQFLQLWAPMDSRTLLITDMATALAALRTPEARHSLLSTLRVFVKEPHLEWSAQALHKQLKRDTATGDNNGNNDKSLTADSFSMSLSMSVSRSSSSVAPLKVAIARDTVTIFDEQDRAERRQLWAEQRIDIVRMKLRGRPAHEIVLRDLRTTPKFLAKKEKYVAICTDLVEGRHNGTQARALPSEQHGLFATDASGACANSTEQAKSIMEFSSDKSVLSVAYFGWAPHC
ncbi:MAG: hypothetical protein MHM6MM_001216 [Cercozoa sp. M6MM]